MPARASSASCRGAAAAAASDSISSLRCGRCCSEPAMGAQGSARAEARCGRRLQRPALPEPRSDLPGAEQSSRQGAGRDAEAEPPPGCGAGNVGALPPPPAAQDYSAAGSRPPQPFRVSAPASIQRLPSRLRFPQLLLAPEPAPAAPGPGSRLLTPTRGPKAQSSQDRVDLGRTGRAGELDSGSENAWSSATERGRTPRWLGLGLQCQNPWESPPTSPRPGPLTRPKAANPRTGGRWGRGLKHLNHLLGPTTYMSAKERRGSLCHIARYLKVLRSKLLKCVLAS